MDKSNINSRRNNKTVLKEEYNFNTILNKYRNEDKDKIYAQKT